MQHSNPPLGLARSLWRLRPYVGGHIYAFLGAFLATVIGWLAGIAVAQVLGRFIDGPLRTPGATAVAAVLPFAGITLVLGLIQALTFVFRRWFIARPGTDVETRMRTALYAKLQDLPIVFHNRWPSGQLLSRCTSDLTTIRNWLSFGLILTLSNVVVIAVGAIVLLINQWILGMIFLGCFVPLWVRGWFFERRYRVVARQIQDQGGDLATAVEESVHGLRILKSFGRGPFALDQFRRRALGLRASEIDRAKLNAGITAWILLIPATALSVCLILGMWMVASDRLSVGTLTAFFASAASMAWPIESVGFMLANALEARAAVDRHFEILDTPNDLEDPEDPTELGEVRGELAFHQVHFRFPDSPLHVPDLLNGVNFVVRPGETLALVGLTGCGKSAIAALATRMLDPTSGSITLDGVDLRQLRRADLHRAIAATYEEPTLFNTTVRENVLYGCQDLDPVAQERALSRALNVAQAGFVYELSDQVAAGVGESGTNLSGGQRQRLALARAVAAAPDVLVLDDPLSALDVETEERVQKELKHALTGTTVFVIAHRPSTVAFADRVILLHRGVIVATGTHTELLRTSPEYRWVLSSLEKEPSAVPTDQPASDSLADAPFEVDHAGWHPPTGTFQVLP